MSSFNKIIIVGHLGRDPELRYTPQGHAVCSFSVATTEKRKDTTGEQQDITTWFNISVWNRQAEVANQYLSKGRQVYIEGRLRTREYTDKDGARRTSLDVTATDVQFLGSRGDDAGGGFQSSQTSSPRPGSQQPAEMDPGGPPDNDIPF
jgi:single-strand DNA-binding protein